MLRKLLKHEFRATGRIMLPLYLVLLVMSVFGNVATRVMEHSSSKFLNLLAGLTMTGFTFLMVTVALMSVWLMVSRFHKNLLTDEGYLMFTLPVSVHKLLISKIVVSTVWFVATFLVAMLSFAALLFRLEGLEYFFSDLGWLFQQIFTEAGGHAMGYTMEGIILVALACAACCLVVYASAAIGHSFANHKILLSFAVFFGFNFLSQFLGIGSILAVDGWHISIAFLDSWSPWAVIHLVMWVLIAMELIYCAIFYVITAITLQKHINLE